MIPEIGHYALILALCVSVVLTLNPREVPSPLAGKLAPSFVLPQLHEQDKTIFSADMTGKVWPLNFRASWCGGCKEEHPVLMRMAKADDAQIYGMDYKDSRHEALTWLRRHGNPYPLTAVEEAGRIGINDGVYGVPETYVIDKAGVIRYKQIGPVDQDILQKNILTLAREL